MIPIKDNIPTDRFPLVTVGLILVNVIVYLLAVRHGGSLISLTFITRISRPKPLVQ